MGRSTIPIVVAMATLLTLPMCSSSSGGDGLSELIGNVQSPGAQILVVRHGKVLYDRVFGTTNRQNGRPVDERTGFEIGSLTKQFTAAAILQLRERGKLALSDPLGKYVPEYAIGRQITLEQLLRHSSGIPDYAQTKGYAQTISHRDGRIAMSRPLAGGTVIGLIKGKPLHFAPGSRFEYSNTNYYLLGMVVAVASDMPYEEYVRTHFFAPAGMNDSSFTDDEMPGSNVATGYSGLNYMRTGPTYGGGDGAIVSTAWDMQRWETALFGGKIVSAPDLALMTSPSAGQNEGYGFGWAIDTYEGQKRLSHNGKSLGFASAVQVYPGLSEHVIVLFATSSVFPDAVANVAFNQNNPAIFALANKASAGEYPEVTTLVKTVWEGAMNGTMDPDLVTGPADDFMSGSYGAAMRVSIGSLGTEEQWIYQGSKSGQTGEVYTYRLLYSTGNVMNVEATVTPHHKVSDIGMLLQ